MKETVINCDQRENDTITVGDHYGEEAQAIVTINEAGREVSVVLGPKKLKKLEKALKQARKAINRAKKERGQ